MFNDSTNLAIGATESFPALAISAPLKNLVQPTDTNPSRESIGQPCSSDSTTLDTLANSGNISVNVVAFDPATSAADAENEALKLAHDHLVEIYISRDSDDPEDWRGRPPAKYAPYWAGAIEHYVNQSDYETVFWVYGKDDGEASKSAVIAELKAVILERGYLLHNANDVETGESIEGIPYRPD